MPWSVVTRTRSFLETRFDFPRSSPGLPRDAQEWVNQPRRPDNLLHPKLPQLIWAGVAEHRPPVTSANCQIAFSVSRADGRRNPCSTGFARIIPRVFAE